MAGKTKLLPAQITKMFKWRKDGRTLREIGLYFGVGPHTVLWHTSPRYRNAKLVKNRKYAAAQNKN